MPLKLSWNNAGMPHGYVCADPVHVVYRLAGCLPVGVLRKLTQELVEQLATLQKLHPLPTDRIEAVKEEFLLAYDELLDAQDQSKYVLSDARAAEVVLKSWRFMHEARWCRVIVVCVMGNHVHVVLEGWAGEEEVPLGRVIGKHKTHCSAALKKLGFELLDGYDSFWAPSFFDRYVRAGFLETVVEYVIDNPKKAGLIRDGRLWPFTWMPSDARPAASGLWPGRT